jgi:hypothetical protein
MTNGRVSSQGLLSWGEAVAAKWLVFKQLAEEAEGQLGRGTRGFQTVYLLQKEDANHNELLSEEANDGDRKITTNMQHQAVIQNFVSNQTEGAGTYVKAENGMLASKVPALYSPHGWRRRDSRDTPLAARLEDDGILVNGARLNWPEARHQREVLTALRHHPGPFGVVPFHSIVAAWTNGETRDWNQAPIPAGKLRKEVGIIVPSTGERWQEVTVKDKHGRTHTRQVHTLGDCVVRVRDRYYLSAVDETGVGSGMYFLAELHTDRPPVSMAEALGFLKPDVVQQAEARGANVRRQGEWFAIPTKLLTSELLRDVERGVAEFRQRHVLGRDGHHELEEAVIYRAGPRKGEVYARGVLKHTGGEHVDLDLGSIRWHLVVHNIQGASYTLSGGGTMAQFD